MRDVVQLILAECPMLRWSGWLRQPKRPIVQDPDKLYLSCLMQGQGYCGHYPKFVDFQQGGYKFSYFIGGCKVTHRTPNYYACRCHYQVFFYPQWSRRIVRRFQKFQVCKPGSIPWILQERARKSRRSWIWWLFWILRLPLLIYFSLISRIITFWLEMKYLKIYFLNAYSTELRIDRLKIHIQWWWLLYYKSSIHF